MFRKTLPFARFWNLFVFQKPYCCTSCDYKTSYRKNLELHKKRNHASHASTAANKNKNKNGLLIKKAHRTLQQMCNRILPKECQECHMKFQIFQDVSSKIQLQLATNVILWRLFWGIDILFKSYFVGIDSFKSHFRMCFISLVCS